MRLFHLFYIQKTLFFIFLTILFLYSCSTRNKEPILNIACSSNFQYAIHEINKVFENKYQITCNTIVGSTGKLASQIINGAPYHIYIAANKEYPQFLNKKKQIYKGPSPFAQGQLALWSKHFKDTIKFETILSPKVKKIAIASTKSAPYGKAAETVLKNKNLLNKLKNKLVFGESIAQVNQFIDNQSVEIGFTSLSTIINQKSTNKGAWCLVSQKLYTPIIQTISITSQSNNYAALYYQFYQTKTTKEIMKKHGYLEP